MKGDVRELLNEYSEVWHYYRFEWAKVIPIDSDVTLVDGGGVFDARRAFEAIRFVFNRYRGEAMLFAFGARVDSRGKVTESRWLSVGHTATLQAAYESLSFGLAKIDAMQTGGSRHSGSGGSDFAGVLGIAIHVEAPRWYGKLSAGQEGKPYRRRKKRQTEKRKQPSEKNAPAKRSGKKAVPARKNLPSKRGPSQKRAGAKKHRRRR